MDIHCARDWLYHEWGADGKCKRCRVTGFRGTQNAATSAGDLSLAVVPLRVHPAGLAYQHDSPVGLQHQPVPVHHDEDDPSFSSSADDPAY